MAYSQLNPSPSNSWWQTKKLSTPGANEGRGQPPPRRYRSGRQRHRHRRWDARGARRGGSGRSPGRKPTNDRATNKLWYAFKERSAAVYLQMQFAFARCVRIASRADVLCNFPRSSGGFAAFRNNEGLNLHVRTHSAKSARRNCSSLEQQVHPPCVPLRDVILCGRPINLCVWF